VCEGNTSDGIYVEDSLRPIIIGNKCRNNGGYGINIANAAVTDALVIQNDLRGNTAGALADAGTDTWIKDNLGYNPVGYISPDPTWGASPWTYTNNDHVPEDVYMQVLTAGDVTSITKNGQDLPLPGTEPTYICSLQPGESIVITYTTAGTLKRFGW